MSHRGSTRSGPGRFTERGVPASSLKPLIPDRQHRWRRPRYTAQARRPSSARKGNADVGDAPLAMSRTRDAELELVLLDDKQLETLTRPLELCTRVIGELMDAVGSR